MGKWYAVKKGYTTGLFATWPDCEKQVKGFKGAEYKSFPTEAQAREYLESGEEDTNTMVVEIGDLYTDGILIAYTDGSFTAGENPKSGYGICFVRNGQEVGHVYGPCTANPALRNVGGELAAAEKAIEIAERLMEPEIIICHDFKNIQMWGDGLWKCNLKETAAFRDSVEEARQNGLAIAFGWVKGHIGNTFNERADQYAAAGANGDVKELLAM